MAVGAARDRCAVLSLAARRPAILFSTTDLGTLRDVCARVGLIALGVFTRRPLTRRPFEPSTPVANDRELCNGDPYICISAVFTGPSQGLRWPCLPYCPRASCFLAARRLCLERHLRIPRRSCGPLHLAARLAVFRDRDPLAPFHERPRLFPTSSAPRIVRGWPPPLCGFHDDCPSHGVPDQPQAYLLPWAEPPRSFFRLSTLL